MIPFPRTLSLRKPTLKTANGTATLTLGGTAQLPTGAAALRLYRGKTAAGLTPSVTLAKSGTSFRGTLRLKQTAKPQIVFLQARATRRGRHGHVHADVRRPVRRRHARGCRRAQRHRPLRDPGAESG